MPDPRDPALFDEGAHASVEQLADLLEGELPDDQAGAVAAHVGGCNECAAAQQQLAAVPALLAATAVPPMPAAVADRLDAALAAESARRTDRQQHAETETVVVPLSRLRRDRVRHWFAGAVTAAAVLLAITVLPDLGGVESGSSDEAASSAAGGAGAADGLQQQRTGPAESGSAWRGDLSAADALPELSSEQFAAGVELLHDSGAARYRSLSPQTADDARRGTLNFETAVGCTGRNKDGALAVEVPRGLVRVDGEPARLEAFGPTRQRAVKAYSCRTGDRLAAATVDLSR